MANTFAPHGFTPVMRQDGAMWTGQTTLYRIANAYATSIFYKDMVTQATDGTITKTTAGTNAAATPCGIFMGCQYTNSAGLTVKSPYWPASTALLGSSLNNVEAYVVDDPNILFEAQFSNVGAAETGTHAQTDVGAMYDLSVAAASASGSTATGLTNASIDYASLVTTIQKARLVRWLDRLDNDPTLANARGLFAFGNHQFRLNTGI